MLHALDLMYKDVGGPGAQAQGMAALATAVCFAGVWLESVGQSGG